MKRFINNTISSDWRPKNSGKTINNKQAYKLERNTEFISLPSTPGGNKINIIQASVDWWKKSKKSYQSALSSASALKLESWPLNHIWG